MNIFITCTAELLM